MKHSFDPTHDDCARCVKERTRRAAQAAANAPPTRRRRSSRRLGERYASRAEQQRTYLDCGPSAWDDRDSESGDY